MCQTISKLTEKIFFLENDNQVACALFWYDTIDVRKKVVKESSIVEFLVDWAIEDYEAINVIFQTKTWWPFKRQKRVREKEDSWKMYFVGFSNALGYRVGMVLISPKGEYYPFTIRLNFDCINNVTKYEACVMGLYMAIKKKIKVIYVYGDSALVIYQLQEDWETRCNTRNFFIRVKL